MLIGGVYMLESILKHSSKRTDNNGDILNDLLSNLLSGQNAKVTIKIEAGKSRNQRGETGEMESQSLSDNYNPSTLDLMSGLTGGLFGSESAPVEGGVSPDINRSPLSNDVLGNLLGGGGPEKMIPLELLLAVLAKLNPYAGSVGSPAPAGGGDLLSALLGGGGGAMPTQPTPPAGLPFMEGMPGMPPVPPGIGGAPGMPSMPPELGGAPGMPPTGGGGIEELLKQLMAGGAR